MRFWDVQELGSGHAGCEVWDMGKVQDVWVRFRMYGSEVWDMQEVRLET